MRLHLLIIFFLITEVVTSSCGLIDSTPAEWEFTIAENGVTIVCNQFKVGTLGNIKGVIYTKRTKDQITAENASTTCTSGITDMTGLFQGNTTFNQDIRSWDVSSVADMSLMFNEASSFNRNIAIWDVSSVTSMNAMFNETSSFNQNLSNWCVNRITSTPDRFSENSALSSDNHPIWGTCPSD